MPSLKLPRPDKTVLAKRKTVINRLGKLIGKEKIISDEAGRRVFEADALIAYRQMPMAVVMPQSTHDVVEILKLCKDYSVKVVPRGAGTSLSGAALPLEDSIVICVSRMNKVLNINYEDRTIAVETGITNLAVTQAVQAHGFFYAPDPSSQLACTIAGNIALNAGGAHCLKYGVTAQHVLGLTVVTIDGQVLSLGGPHMDACGYDLLSLIIGSEGQFGIVTEAILRILPKPEGARPALLGFTSVEAAGACVSAILATGILPTAIEFMDKAAVQLCEKYSKAGYPVDAEGVLIVEVEGSKEEINEQLARICEVAALHNPSVVTISESEQQSAAIWKGRKSIAGAVGKLADYYTMDGTIPTGRLAEILPLIHDISKNFDLRILNVFHAGDGNLHPIILYNANNPEEATKAEKCGFEILKLCVQMGGSLTGEHGVGLEKRDLMPAQFTPQDLEQQMRIRDIFDPDWLLNPGKVFPLDLEQKRA